MRANTAFATAGAIGAVAGSPMPAHRRAAGLRDLRDDAAEALVHGEAARASLRRRGAPPGLFGGQPERACMSRRIRQQREAVLERILARCMRHLVDDALERERRVRMTDGAPPQHGHRSHIWEFQKGSREIKVRVEGQLVVNGINETLNAARAGIGLGFVPEDLAEPYVAKGQLRRVLDDLCPPFPGFHLYYPSRRQSSLAFSLLVEALRYRP